MKSTFSGWRYLWKSEDIRRKLIITFAILALYRLVANIPAPGVDFAVLAAFRASSSGSGNFLDFLDLLSAVRFPISHCYQWVCTRILRRRSFCNY